MRTSVVIRSFVLLTSELGRWFTSRLLKKNTRQGLSLRNLLRSRPFPCLGEKRRLFGITEKNLPFGVLSLISCWFRGYLRTTWMKRRGHPLHFNHWIDSRFILFLSMFPCRMIGNVSPHQEPSSVMLRDQLRTLRHRHCRLVPDLLARAAAC